VPEKIPPKVELKKYSSVYLQTINLNYSNNLYF